LFLRKPQPEETPQELTDIWNCSNDGCNGWMRADFAFESEPVCILCKSPMEKGTKMLPPLVDSNFEHKNAPKKGASAGGTA